MYESFDRWLITNALKYIKDTDEDEKHFAFELIDQDVRNYTKKLDNNGLFEKWYSDPKLKKQVKSYKKQASEKPLLSVMNVSAHTNVDGDTYKLFAKLAGPLTDYSDAVIKKKIRKFVNVSRLTYIKLVKNDDTVILELGQEQLGQQFSKVV